MELHYESAGDRVSATATGDSKEIAALVAALQERQSVVNVSTVVADGVAEEIAKLLQSQLSGRTGGEI